MWHVYFHFHFDCFGFYVNSQINANWMPKSSTLEADLNPAVFSLFHYLIRLKEANTTEKSLPPRFILKFFIFRNAGIPSIIKEIKRAPTGQYVLILIYQQTDLETL